MYVCIYIYIYIYIQYPIVDVQCYLSGGGPTAAFLYLGVPNFLDTKFYLDPDYVNRPCGCVHRSLQTSVLATDKESRDSNRSPILYVGAPGSAHGQSPN